MRLFKSYLLMLIAAFVMVGCADNFDRPPIVEPTAANADKVNTTIYDLKFKYWDDARNYIDTIGQTEAGEDIIIKGRVVSSDETGNIYKSLVIQDETAALALSINQSSLYTTYRLGQEVVINATGMYIGKYNGLQQLGYPEWYAQGNAWEATFMAPEFFQEHAEMNGFPKVNEVDTLVVSLGSLPSDPAGLCQWQSQLVRLDDVMFTEADGKVVFAEDDASANRTLQDLNGNTIIVRNSNYADFRSQKLPIGTGSVVGILSYYGTAWQLLLRSAEDCIGFSTDTKGLKDNPYTMEDVAELQETSKTGWFTGYIVGAVKPGKSAVESNDDIQWEAPAALANTIVLGATAETKDIKECIIIALEEGSDLRNVANLKDNEGAYQKNLLVKATAFKAVYGHQGLVTSGQYADFVLEGTASPSGDGTKESPYSVAHTISNIYADGAQKAAWITGYIVGGVDGKSITDNAVFSAATATNSNILISDNPNAQSIAECIPVQLPKGAVRSALNLVDNPGNLGKKVKLNGSVEKFFLVAGFKTVTEFEIEGGGSSTPDTPVTTDPVTTLTEGFDTSIPANWKNIKVSGDKAWYQTIYQENGYAAMTGYKGTQPPFESWLITPALNVKDAENKTFTFRTQRNAYGDNGIEVYVMSTNDPATAVLNKLTISLPSKPSVNYSDWMSIGTFDLSTYGDVVYVGVKYLSTDAGNSTTWCVDDVKFGDVATGGETPGVGGGETPGTGGETPSTPSTPTTGTGTKDAPYSVATAKSVYVEGSATAAWIEGYIVGCVNGPSLDSNAVIGLPNGATTADNGAKNLLISDNPNATSVSECIPVQLPSGSVRTALNLVENPTNLGKKVKLNGSIEKYFLVAGFKSVKEFEFVN